MKRLYILLLSAASLWGAVAHTNGNKATSAAPGTAIAAPSFTPVAGRQYIFSSECYDTTGTPASVGFAATGWSFTSVHALAGNANTGFIATVRAYAPNNTAVVVTATWSQSCTFRGIFYDEFSGGDPTNFIDQAPVVATGTTGSCTQSVTPGVANSMLWSFCADSVTAVGAGFTAGQNDGSGDWTEYKLLSGGSGVAQTVNFTGTTGYWVQATISIKPDAGAVTSVRKRVMVTR